MRTQPSSKRKIRGFAALSLAAIALVFSALIAAGYFYVNHGRQSASVQDQLSALDWARNALDGYAAANGHLPCPSTSRNGHEDCSAGFKGWLPSETLSNFVLPGSVAPKQLAPIFYMVYRGTSGLPSEPDLAEVSEAFSPALQDGEPITGYPQVLSGLDLCGKLHNMVPSADPDNRWERGDTAPLGQNAQVHASPDGSVPAMNVAYAIAVPRAGVGNVSSGVNADFAVPEMESPARPHGPDYADLVQVGDLRQMFDRLGCSAAMAAMDNLAMAVPLAEEVTLLNESNVETAKVEYEGMAFFISADIFEVGSSAIEEIDAVERGIEIAAAIAIDLLGLPFTLPKLAADTTAEAYNVTGSILAYKDVIAYTAFTGTLVGYLAAFEILIDEVLNTPTWGGSEDMLHHADSEGTSHAF